MGDQGGFTEGYGFEIFEDAVDLYRGEPAGPAEEVIRFAPGIQEFGFLFECPHFCSGLFTDYGQPAGVIAVGMGIEQDFGVLVLEPEGLDALPDRRYGVFKSGIDQNISLGSDDEETRKVVLAHVIYVADDSVRTGGVRGS